MSMEDTMQFLERYGTYYEDKEPDPLLFADMWPLAYEFGDDYPIRVFYTREGEKPVGELGSELVDQALAVLNRLTLSGVKNPLNLVIRIGAGVNKLHDKILAEMRIMIKQNDLVLAENAGLAEELYYFGELSRLHMKVSGQDDLSQAEEDEIIALAGWFGRNLDQGTFTHKERLKGIGQRYYRKDSMAYATRALVTASRRLSKRYRDIHDLQIPADESLRRLSELLECKPNLKIRDAELLGALAWNVQCSGSGYDSRALVARLV